jgi:ABC-type sugar transport system substrate-binding protein
MASMLAAAMISAGCGSDSFVPPPPEPKGPDRPGFAATYEGVSSAATSPRPDVGKPLAKRAGGGVRIVELILARKPDGDRAFFEVVLRRELSKVQIPLRTTRPESAERMSPDELAGAIRAAAGRKIAGLIVEPSDEPLVVDALHEALGRGVAVLLLERPVPARDGRTIPHVEYTGFAEVGRQIVQAVLEPDRGTGAARPERIVFLHHRADAPYLERSFTSLLGPCKASGRPIEIIEFEGDGEQAIAALEKSLTTDPAIGTILADDAAGMHAGFRANMKEVKAGRRGFLVAGFTPYDQRIVTALDYFEAIGDPSVEAYASKASQAIRNLIDGKKVAPLVEVPVAFNRNPHIPTSAAKETAASPADRER